MRIFIAAAFFLLALTPALHAQQRHWIFFSDRGPDAGQRLASMTSAALGVSEEALLRRAASDVGATPGLLLADLPPLPTYVRQVEATGATITVQSRWLNAVSVTVDKTQLLRISALPFVSGIEPVRRFRRPPVPQEPLLKQTASLSPYGFDYGPSLPQLEMIRVPQVHDIWIDGTGITVGMLDNGFRWRPHEVFSIVKVKGEYDFINLDSLTENEEGDLYGQDAHGTSTFSALAGFKQGQLIGPAFNADYYLGKTEKNGSETQIEEDYWVQGIEWLEAKGASIVSASLGYLDWDDGTGYVWAEGDLDGRTAVTTRAAVEAMRRGVVVVTAMGNEGSAPGSLIAPADADSIVSVGAVNYDKSVAGFSSRGPTSDQRGKPDISAPGVSVYCANKYGFDTYEKASGTSLATPLAAGVAALVRSARPELTAVQVRDALRATADQTDAPDNNRGYGMIDAWEAVLHNGMVISTNPKIFWTGSASTIMAWVVSKNTVDAGSVTLEYAAGGTAQSVPMKKLDNYPGEGSGSGLYAADISGLAVGTEVLFNVRASDSRETRTSPYGAPEHRHQFVVGESRTLGAENMMPADFALEESAPNPFVTGDGGTALISYSVPMPGANVQLRLHDGLGRVIRTLVDDYQGPGVHSVTLWDAWGLSTGVYYYSLSSGERQIMRRLVIVK
ncbi:MAG: S8 family serine peptidase [Bacteroidetes bacterium]|nr:S8 family serine peptidase [Bacteroidota bacterium]